MKLSSSNTLLEDISNLKWVYIIYCSIYLFNLASGDLTYDNILYAAVSKGVLYSENPLLLKLAEFPYANKPPLFFLLNSLILFFTGFSVWSAKLLSVFWGAGCILLIYRISMKIVRDREISMLSSFVFTTTYTILRYTRSCRMESMLTFFVLAGFYTFIVFLETKKLRWILFTGIYTALGFLTKGPAALISLLAIGTGLLFKKSHNSRKIWFHFLLASLLCILLIFTWIIFLLNHKYYLDIFLNGEILSRISSSFTQSSPKNYPVSPIYSYVLYLIKHYFYYIVFTVSGINLFIKQHRLSIPGFTIICFTVIYWLVIHLVPTRYERYLYLLYAFLSIYTAIGIKQFIKHNSISFIKWLSICIICLAVFIPGVKGKEGYNVLYTLNREASEKHMDIVADSEFYTYWENKSAMYYFCDHYLFKPEKAPFYLVTSKLLEKETLLYKNRKLKVYEIQSLEGWSVNHDTYTAD